MDRFVAGLVGALIPVALSCVTPGCAKPVTMTGQVEWQRDDRFGREDRREILEAATQAGFAQVRKVSKRWHRPSTDQYHVLIESNQTVTGRRVTWALLMICGEIDRRHCDDERGNRPWVRVGEWMTSASIVQMERWRVIDADWHIDVALDDGVTESIADAIILAMHRQSLVNRTGRPDLLIRGDAQRALDHRFVGIERKAARDDRYVVTTSNDGTGYVFEMRVFGDRVEVGEVSYWDA